MSDGPILVELRDGIRVVTLHRPDRLNAFDRAMHEGLADALELDDGARAVVLTGAGRAFSAGGDRDLLGDLDGATAAALGVLARRQMLGILASPLPVVAAVNGPAIGYAASLVAFCDFVVLADDAFLADPHVSLGMEPSLGCALAWPRQAPLAVVKELILSGRRLGADEALRHGFANRVVPTGEVLAAALALAAEVTVAPPDVVAGAKRTLNAALVAAYDAAMTSDP